MEINIKSMLCIESYESKDFSYGNKLIKEDQIRVELSHLHIQLCPGFASQYRDIVIVLS